MKIVFRPMNKTHPGIIDLVPMIFNFMVSIALKAYRKKKKIFRIWEDITIFHPSPSVPPNEYHWSHTPNHEYLRYHKSFFVRRKHSIGITLAVMTGHFFVIWTYNRKAFVFNFQGTILKILNRQDDPFITWVRHLNGKQLFNLQTHHTSLETLFEALVVPLYGSHPKLRSRISMRGVASDHPIWSLICTVSYKLPIPESTRQVWHNERVMRYSGVQ